LAAYQLSKLPRFLVNIGTAHYRLRNPQQALSVYENYLKLEPHPPSEVFTKVQDMIERCRAALAAPDQIASPPPPSPSSGASRNGSRPRWRLAVGSILLGGGLVLTGFGAAALAVNGNCYDGSSPTDTCTPYYNTTGVGSGLLGGGAALAISGTVMLALPGNRPKPPRGAN
jgi:hypothetical protein